LVYITRRFHFSASHRVYNPEFADDKNYEIYGKCANPSGHGHNYIMDVTIAGDVDPQIGFVMDLTELKHLVEKRIIEKVDHHNLNTDVEFMKDIIPSTENIAIKFWEQIEPSINNSHRKLHSIRLQETVNNTVEYKGKQ
jgi:6-pyruvoyltetrahydropterin/6-carboxytetrahydropterin synthase